MMTRALISHLVTATSARVFATTCTRMLFHHVLPLQVFATLIPFGKWEANGRWFANGRGRYVGR